MLLMRCYLRGYVSWFIMGGNSPSDAERKARDCVGCCFYRMPWYRRWLWWLSCGVQAGNTMWA